MITTALLAAALFEAANKIVEKGIVDPALENGLAPFSDWITSGYDRKKAELELQKAFSEAIKAAGAPSNDEDLMNWLTGVGLDRLQSDKNDILRQKVAQAIIGFTNNHSPLSEDLLADLRWPRSQRAELYSFLSSIRHSLSTLDEWRPLIQYADAAAERGILQKILDQLTDWNSLMVWSENGKAIKVVIDKMGLSQSDVASIERHYRDELISKLYWHNFRGIVQVKQDLRLPLRKIYLELSIVELHGHEEQQKPQLKFSQLDQEEYLQIEESRPTIHLTEILPKYKRVVMLGDPGTGKTISLRFIALMLAYGTGAAHLGLNEPLIPVIIRLADFARELEKRRSLSLENYLIEYIQQAFSGGEQLGEFLRLALKQGKCMLLLDGLDELATDVRAGKVSHEGVVSAVQNLSEVFCNGSCINHLIVTSRREGYWNDPLRGFVHIQLGALRIPDEVEAFLKQWYSAHEQVHDQELPIEKAEARAQERVHDLLPRVLSTTSVRRLATNPLLLTILALINENVGRLPNRRIKLYEIAAQTLIESWRQLQSGLEDNLLAELGEDTIIRIMAPLAYWLHENRPGGTASLDDWRDRLKEILRQEGFEQEAEELTVRFLHHARFQTGLLTERSPNQFGFFHLTFEEYLAARQIARQREEIRRQMLKLHWSDPRWQEVLLLTAGQLGIAESKTDDVSAFIEDLLKMDTESEDLKGRPAILAGRALVDIGTRSVTAATRRWVDQALLDTAQDNDPDTHKPYHKHQTPILVRAVAADVLDDLSHTLEDLYVFVEFADFWIGKFPVTNSQYQRFIEAPDYMDPELWMKFPMFDENCTLMKESWELRALEWRSNFLDQTKQQAAKINPEYWNDIRLGILRKNVPIIGISWYEANSYCKWLSRHWGEWPESKNDIPNPTIIRLPTSNEWQISAGGMVPADRYAWDKKGQVSKNLEDIICRANVRESKLGSTTPVWMYPTGASPNGVMDMSGNTWEWQANFSHSEHKYLALRGGSWNVPKELSCVRYNFYFHPFDRSSSIGFRLLIPKDFATNTVITGLNLA